MDANSPARERRKQEYSSIQATDRGRVHYGDNYVIPYNHRERSDYDSDTDPEEEGLPEGWDAAKSQDGETYYVSPISSISGNGTTTWVKPMHGLAHADASIRRELGRLFSDVLSPELVHSSNTAGHEAATLGMSPRSDVEVGDNMRHIDPVSSDDGTNNRKHNKKSRCSIFTEGKSVTPENLEPTDAVGRLLEERRKNEDSICIIENIDGDLIRALHAASELNLPREFFARHTGSVVSQPARQGTYIPLMDDLVQRAIPLGKRIQKKKAEESVKKIIDTLSETRECVKTSVDNWVMCGVTEEELDRVASCVAECTSTLDKLKGKASETGRPASVSKPISLSARPLHRQMDNLDFLRHRRYFNLSAIGTRIEHTKGLLSVEQENTHVSYIRVNRTLCLIMVDSLPPAEHASGVHLKRGGTSFKFPHACAGNGLDIPELLEESNSGLYESLKAFAQDAWRTEILCGEQKVPPTYEEYLEELSMNGAPASYTALDPQAFLVMLSSAVWERNLRHLEQSLGIINAERLRDADSVSEMVKIKKELFDNREHLGRLVTQVEHAMTHMPAYLNEYYEAFPTIRHRHKATYMSPVAHLPELLARASKLDKLILDDFQILMSSVSVQEGHDSTQQTRLATGIAVLAFIYVPLTLVTGIFGMNIDGTNGFAWWAPIVALAGVVILTVGLLGIAFHSSTAWRQTINASGIVVKGAALLSALTAPFGKSKTVLTDEEAAISKDK